MDRVAGRGSGRLGHGHRARGHDQPLPCRGVTVRHRVRPAAADASPEPGTVTRAQPAVVIQAQPGAVTKPGTVTQAITEAEADAERDTVTGAVTKPGTVTQADADPGRLDHPRALTQPFAGAGAPEAVTPRRAASRH